MNCQCTCKSVYQQLTYQNDRHSRIAIDPTIHWIQKILDRVMDADMREVHKIGKFVEEKPSHK